MIHASVLLLRCRKAFFPQQKEEEQGENSANAVIRREYAKLGPITYAAQFFYLPRRPNEMSATFALCEVKKLFSSNIWLHAYRPLSELSKFSVQLFVYNTTKGSEIVALIEPLQRKCQ